MTCIQPIRAMLLIPILVVATLARAETEPAALRIPVAVPITDKDPFDVGPLEEWEVLAGVHETLVRYDLRETVSPGLAQSWTYDEGKALLPSSSGPRQNTRTDLRSQPPMSSEASCGFCDETRRRRLSSPHASRRPLAEGRMLPETDKVSLCSTHILSSSGSALAASRC